MTQPAHNGRTVHSPVLTSAHASFVFLTSVGLHTLTHIFRQTYGAYSICGRPVGNMPNTAAWRTVCRSHSSTEVPRKMEPVRWTYGVRKQRRYRDYYIHWYVSMSSRVLLNVDSSFQALSSKYGEGRLKAIQPEIRPTRSIATVSSQIRMFRPAFHHSTPSSSVLRSQAADLILW